MSNTLSQIQQIDKNIQHYEREQIRLETELANSQKQEKEIVAELKEKSLPTNIAELRSMYKELDAGLQEEVEKVKAELAELEKEPETVEEESTELDEDLFGDMTDEEVVPDVKPSEDDDDVELPF